MTHQLLSPESGLYSREIPATDFPAAIPVAITVEDIFTAYFDCRKNKRNTINSLRFEQHYEHNLFELLQDINSGDYEVGRSVAFTVDQPVKREIFCSDFRDRVVHHLLVAKLNPLFEKMFIADSYACRKEKGTLYGVDRISRFLRSCSRGYTRSCYVMKMDVRGFFMHINRDTLCRRLMDFIDRKYHAPDRTIIQDLCRKVVMNDPTDYCYVKGSLSNWDDLPADKSLLKMKSLGVAGSGLPIGNLTSQVFANFYMHAFDHYMKHQLRLKYYGRYVDDIVVVHEDKDYLQEVRSRAGVFLEQELGLHLHPKKHYLQHYSKGVPFLGVHVAPHFSYPGKRLKRNTYEKLYYWNRLMEEGVSLSPAQLENFRAQINSYLGFMVHHNTYRLRRKLLLHTLSKAAFRYCYIVNTRKVRLKPIARNVVY